MIETLPPISSLSPSVLSFLNDKLHTKADLQLAPSLVSELQIQCNDLDTSLTDLSRRLHTSILAYASCSDQVGALIGVINAKLSGLQSLSGFISLCLYIYICSYVLVYICTYVS